jgi:hypothetical protein
MVASVAVVPDNPFRYKISLENDYLTIFGAKPSHEIKIGDKVRFVREAPRFETGLEFVPNYVEDGSDFELSVAAINLGAGINGSDEIQVETFDLNLFSSWITGGNIDGALMEISTPQQETQEGLWRETEYAFNVLGANTNERRHEGEKVSVTTTAITTTTVTVVGDFSNSQGYYLYQYFPSGELAQVEQIETAVYNEGTNTTVLTVDTVILTATTFVIGYDQSTLPALCNMEGDIYLRQRYRATNIGINGWKYIRLWELDPDYSDYFASRTWSRGRIGFSNINTKRKKLNSTAVHSNSFIDQSNINRLNQFEYQNRVSISEEYGSINRVIINGFTLMCLQDRKNTSVYLGANMINDASGQSNLVTSSAIFGNTRAREEDWGTVHGESVHHTPAGVCYYDYLNGQFVIATNNGQEAISGSKYKFNRYATELTAGTTFNSRVVAVYDDLNKEVVWYFNDRSEAVVFSLKKMRWTTAFEYVVDFMFEYGNRYFALKEGQLYEMNKGDELEFFGEQQTAYLKFVSAKDANLNKRYETIALKTNGLWSMTNLTVPQSNSYGEMNSYLPKNLFKIKEGFLFSQFRRDINSPNFATQELAWLKGRQLRGVSTTIELIYEETQPCTIFSAVVTSQYSESII